MNLAEAHERSVQVAGDGYVETRRFWFGPNSEFARAHISVVLTDGTTTNLIATNTDGVILIDSDLRYPGHMHLTAGFSVDGRATISHYRTDTRDTTHWNYRPDGSADVQREEWVQGHSVTTTRWSTFPDGAPTGDLYEHILEYRRPDGTRKEVETFRTSDGTVMTKIRVWTAEGVMLSDETNTEHSGPLPELPPSEGTVQKRPPPSTGTSGSGGFEPTTRSPDPRVVTSGGGWVGGGGTPDVRVIIDWWYRGPDGRTIYLGSTTEPKTKKE